MKLDLVNKDGFIDENYRLSFDIWDYGTNHGFHQKHQYGLLKRLDDKQWKLIKENATLNGLICHIESNLSKYNTFSQIISYFSFVFSLI